MVPKLSASRENLGVLDMGCRVWRKRQTTRKESETVYCRNMRWAICMWFTGGLRNIKKCQSVRLYFSSLFLFTHGHLERRWFLVFLGKILGDSENG